MACSIWGGCQRVCQSSSGVARPTFGISGFRGCVSQPSAPGLCTPFEWVSGLWRDGGFIVPCPSIGCSLLLFLSWAGMVGAFIGGTQPDGALVLQVFGGYLIQGQGGAHVCWVLLPWVLLILCQGWTSAGSCAPESLFLAEVCPLWLVAWLWAFSLMFPCSGALVGDDVVVWLPAFSRRRVYQSSRPNHSWTNTWK